MLGYTRQRIRANWKLYAENTRDNYHASLLHEFLVTFGLDRSTQIGGLKMDPRHRHSITWAEADSDTDEAARAAYNSAGIRNDYLTLREPDLVNFRPDRADRLNLVVTRCSRHSSLRRSATAWRSGKSAPAGSMWSRSTRRCSVTRTTRRK